MPFLHSPDTAGAGWSARQFSDQRQRDEYRHHRKGLYDCPMPGTQRNRRSWMMDAGDEDRSCSRGNWGSANEVASAMPSNEHRNSAPLAKSRPPARVSWCSNVLGQKVVIIHNIQATGV